MKRKLTDKVRISHVLDAIGEVEKYLKGATFLGFLDNSEKRFATIKQIETIGEACNRMSKGFKDKHAEIRWKEINGFRNISIHEYFGVTARTTAGDAGAKPPCPPKHQRRSLARYKAVCAPWSREGGQNR